MVSCGPSDAKEGTAWKLSGLKQHPSIPLDLWVGSAQSGSPKPVPLVGTWLILAELTWEWLCSTGLFFPPHQWACSSPGDR